jgi:hypothetical protein
MVACPIKEKAMTLQEKVYTIQSGSKSKYICSDGYRTQHASYHTDGIMAKKGDMFKIQ